MSSLNKISKSFRRIHKERDQPFKRKELGILPKKSDYKKRAINHHQRKKLLKAYKEKAYNKNWDEFYFKMINSKPQDFDQAHKSDLLSKEQELLIKSQDINYLRYKRNINIKQIEKLKQENFMDVTDNNHLIFCEPQDNEKFSNEKFTNAKMITNLITQIRPNIQLQKRLKREHNLSLLQSKLESKNDKSKTYKIRIKNGKFLKIPLRKS